MYRQQKTKCLKLIKLRQDKPTGPHRDNHDEFMPVYLTQTNQILVQAMVDDMVDHYLAECGSKSRQSYKDDSLVMQST